MAISNSWLRLLNGIGSRDVFFPIEACQTYDNIGIHGSYLGLMERNMETTKLLFRVLGCSQGMLKGHGSFF